MNRKVAIVGMVVFALFSAPLKAAERRVFQGEVVDRKIGARYVLSNTEDKTVYHLDDEKAAAPFAGDNVLVVGALDETTGTIHVSEMMRILPPKVMKAVLVYVDCFDCPREMASVKKVGVLEVGKWKRFYLSSNPRRTDLIFLFSAAPYLGDYITRDKPPGRPVPVEITYMNVIDPQTGESLWTDYRKWGSWFVGPAAQDLIGQFKAQVDAQEGRTASLLAFDADQNRKAPPNEGK
jgi:hypothetical protein